MAKVNFGNHSKIIALSSEQGQIRKFYCDVLGCEATKLSKTVDYFRIGNDFFLAVLYGDSVLSQSDLLKSIWLEIRTDDPKVLNAKIRDFGIREIESWDKDHLYFQAPGGQVFRVVKVGEELTRFER